MSRVSLADAGVDRGRVAGCRVPGLMSPTIKASSSFDCAVVEDRLGIRGIRHQYNCVFPAIQKAHSRANGCDLQYRDCRDWAFRSRFGCEGEGRIDCFLIVTYRHPCCCASSSGLAAGIKNYIALLRKRCDPGVGIYWVRPPLLRCTGWVRQHAGSNRFLTNRASSQ